MAFLKVFGVKVDKKRREERKNVNRKDKFEDILMVSEI
jgi:hypothetical protein